MTTFLTMQPSEYSRECFERRAVSATIRELEGQRESAQQLERMRIQIVALYEQFLKMIQQLIVVPELHKNSIKDMETFITFCANNQAVLNFWLNRLATSPNDSFDIKVSELLTIIIKLQENLKASQPIGRMYSDLREYFQLTNYVDSPMDVDQGNTSNTGDATNDPLTERTVLEALAAEGY